MCILDIFQLNANHKNCPIFVIWFIQLYSFSKNLLKEISMIIHDFSSEKINFGIKQKKKRIHKTLSSFHCNT